MLASYRTVYLNTHAGDRMCETCWARIIPIPDPSEQPGREIWSKMLYCTTFSKIQVQLHFGKLSQERSILARLGLLTSLYLAGLAGC